MMKYFRQPVRQTFFNKAIHQDSLHVTENIYLVKIKLRWGGKQKPQKVREFYLQI